jgi:hypothetical protein
MRVSAQGLEQRFTEAGVRFMRSLLEEGLQLLISSPQSRTLLPQFAGVYLTDSTRLVWGKQRVKLGVRLELQQGQLQAHLAELTQNDQTLAVVEQTLPKGALHLGDLGFFKLKRFQKWSQEGVYWLTRYKVGTHLFTPQGQAIALAPLLAAHKEPFTLPVLVGCGERVKATLLAAPLTDEALEKRQARLKEQARLDQRPLSAQQTDLMGWTLYLTNVPDLSFEQAHILARTRWQIELLFKLWKSHAALLKSRSADPLRQQCEGYAKLLGVLVAHWLLLVTGWHHDTLSAVDALRILRTYVPLLSRAFTQPVLWPLLFDCLRADFQAAARLSSRRAAPLAFQLWASFPSLSP